MNNNLDDSQPITPEIAPENTPEILPVAIPTEPSLPVIDSNVSPEMPVDPIVDIAPQPVFVPEGAPIVAATPELNKTIQKKILIIVSAIVIILVAAGAGYLFVNFYADNTANSYAASVQSYLDSVNRIANTNTGDTISKIKSLGELKKPKVPAVFLGDINEKYMDTKVIADKTAVFYAQIDEFAAVCNYEDTSNQVNNNLKKITTSDKSELFSAVIDARKLIKKSIDDNINNAPSELKTSYTNLSKALDSIIVATTSYKAAYDSKDEAAIKKAEQNYSDTVTSVTISMDTSERAIDAYYSGIIGKLRTSFDDLIKGISSVSTIQIPSQNMTEDGVDKTTSNRKIVQISAGDFYTCATTSDNLFYCWGDYGLANGSFSSTSTPTAVNISSAIGGATVKSFISGSYIACLLSSVDKAYCWGINSQGQLGNNSTAESAIPVAVDASGDLSGKTIKSISTSNQTTCAIASDDQAYCWGKNSMGELGNGSKTESHVPVAISMSGALSGKTIKSISVNNGHSCVIASDNNAYCWGYNGTGQLGNNSTSTSLVPVAVDTSGVLKGKTIKSISVGQQRSCAIASDDQAYCWGYGESGRLGNNLTKNSLVPVAVDTSGVLKGKTILSISVGEQTTCVIT
jgi:hypothetical protein